MSGFSLNLVLRHNRVSIRWHMTKLQIKSDRITSFGGIYFVNRLFDQFSLGKVINDTLGLRSTRSGSEPYLSIVLNGSTALPRRLDILLPFLSNTNPLEITALYDTLSNIIVAIA